MLASDFNGHVPDREGKAMKQLAAVFGMAVALGFPLFVLAAQGTCSVTPEQVPLGGSYTLSVQGLEPNSTYWVILTQLGLVVYTRLRLAHSVRPSEQSSSLSARQSVAPRLTAPQLSVSSPPVDPSTARLSHTNLIVRLLNGKELPELSTEQVQSYLEKNRRSVGSLMAHSTPRTIRRFCWKR